MRQAKGCQLSAEWPSTRVKLIAQGDDAWEKVWIESNVYFGELRHIAGTIDSFVWSEDWETFSFGQDVVLSTDPSEGHSTWTLND